MKKSLFFTAALLLLPACEQIASSGLAEAAGLGFAPAEPASLESAVTNETDKRFYAARQWQPVWTAETYEVLKTALNDAPRHGLVPKDFLDPDKLPADAAARELAITNAARAFASALARGKVDPKTIDDVYTLPRPKVDIDAGLQTAAADGRIGEWLSGLSPQTEDYARLSEAYLRYRDEAEKDPEADIPGGKTLKAGERDPRVPAIVAALKGKGLLGDEPAGAGGRYDAAVAAGVKKLQARNGLEVDGVFGPDTRAALNASAADRARQIAVNLERLRWLERTPPETRIDVNTAAAQLVWYRDGQIADQRRVAVGQQGWETPRLGSPLFRLVANPTWTVPKSIEKDEIAGKGEAYLRRKNMVRRDGYIVQQPGPGNALGQVKFDMQNDHAIYLHDTPAKAVFQTAERHVSHGCVRVSDAIGFARKLAEAEGVLDEFEAGLASGDETFVPLERQIPVRLIYLTATPGADGRIAFYDDAYGWDDELATKLGLSGRARWLKRDPIEDGGP